MNDSKRNGLVLAGLVTALLITVLLLPQPVIRANQSELVLTNVRIFDGFDVHESATLVVRDGLVHSLESGPVADSSVEVIDASGKTLIPGLIDAHVHAYGPALSISPMFGVTTLLDMFRPPLDQTAMIAARQSLSGTDKADLFSAGYLATASGGHGTQYGIQVPTLSGPDPAGDWVAERLADGSDYIKIVIEDGSTWSSALPTLDESTVRALVDAAHNHGLLAVAHVSTLANARVAINAGVDGLVHLFTDEPVDAEFVELAREAGIFIIPTATVLASVLGHSGADWLTSDSGFGDQLTAMQRQTLLQRFPGSDARGNAWPGVLASIAVLHAGGIPILAGSDAPNPGTAFGASLHHELKLLVDAGLSPVEALKAASSVTAGAFELTGRGCLQAGCRADFVLIDGDPTADITAATRIAGVWKNGHPVSLERNAPKLTQEPSGEVVPISFLDHAAQWMASSDSYMGGESTATIAFVDDSLRVEGTLNPGFPFPYAGAMWTPGEQPMQAVDFSGMSRLRLAINGSMTAYQVMVFSGDMQSAPARLEIEAGDEIIVEFSDLPMVDPSQLRAVGVFASGQNGAFRFDIKQAIME